MRDMFKEAIKTEQRRIQRLIDLSTISDDRRGSLCLQKRGQKIYAYERWQAQGRPEKRVYLGLLDSNPVREFCSMKYQKRRLEILRGNQKILQQLEQEYQAYDYESVISGMPTVYRRVPGVNDFNQRYEEIREWANADYPKNPYPFSSAKNYAADGTRLRSKGECIFYNLLRGRGILFRNDCVIEIVDKQGNLKRLCPDFMILCFDGTIIIIEHLGRIGELRYSLDFGERCYWYFHEGFILGSNFFVTSDDPDYGTDSQVISRVVDRVEELFFGF